MQKNINKMGLSVAIYTNIRKCNASEDYSFLAYTLDDFKENVSTLEWEGRYVGDLVKENASYPYSMHKSFRQLLAGLSGNTFEAICAKPHKYRDMPFFELIYFADNEGGIDGKTSQKLHKDFEDFDVLAKERLSIEYYELYTEWFETFDLAKGNGYVEFC